MLPDLRWSAITATEASWDAVLQEGALTTRGMVSFADRLDKEETDAIRAYVVRQAWNAQALDEADARKATAADMAAH